MTTRLLRCVTRSGRGFFAPVPGPAATGEAWRAAIRPRASCRPPPRAAPGDGAARPCRIAAELLRAASFGALRPRAPVSGGGIVRVASLAGAGPVLSYLRECPDRGERDPSEVMQGHFRHLGRLRALRAG